MIFTGKTLLVLATATLGLLTSTAPAESEKSEPPSLKVLDSQEVDLGARSIIYNRVETPALKSVPPIAARARAPVADHVPTQEELEQTRKWEALHYVNIFLSCTVYDGRWTEVRFLHENTDIVFWSTANFNYFSQMTDLLTKDTYYSLMMMVGDSTIRELEAENAELRQTGQPALAVTPPADLLRLDSNTQKSTWQITSIVPVPPEAQRAIEELHSHYDVNRPALIAEYEARQAAQSAHEKWLRENPPQPQNTIVQFFPIQSDHSPTKAQTFEPNFQSAREK